MINNVVTVSGGQQKGLSYTPQTPLPSRLPHNFEQSSLCGTVGPCWVSVLNSHVYTSIPNSLTIPSPHPYPQRP